MHSNFNAILLPSDTDLNPAFARSTSASKGKKIPVTTITLDYKDQPPSGFPLDIYEVYRTRLISLINGARYALHNNPHIAPYTIGLKIAAIEELLTRKMRELDEFKKATQGYPVTFGTELAQFYNQDLPQVSGLSPKELFLAEAFYVWQHYDRPRRLTRFNRDLGEAGKLYITQDANLRRSPLTVLQKQELWRIHGNNPPHWFRKLPVWAQRILRKLVPEDITGNWDNYQKALPTTLRHILGETNATEHCLKISYQRTPEDKETIIFQSFLSAQGVPTSYEMHDKKERQTSADENLAQMLNVKIPVIKREFRKIWGLAEDEKLPCPIPVLLGGLITPSHQAGLMGTLLDASGVTGGENNTVMAREKAGA